MYPMRPMMYSPSMRPMMYPPFGAPMNEFADVYEPPQHGISIGYIIASLLSIILVGIGAWLLSTDASAEEKAQNSNADQDRKNLGIIMVSTGSAFVLIIWGMWFYQKRSSMVELS